MNIFTIFFSQNILQNAPNCTIFKNFLGGACPQTPLTDAWLCHTQNILNPPPRNKILDTPLRITLSFSS